METLPWFRRWVQIGRVVFLMQGGMAITDLNEASDVRGTGWMAIVLFTDEDGTKPGWFSL